MPEGHTIHRAARDQTAMLAGAGVAASSPQGRFADGARCIDGRTLTVIDAHGKHLLYRFDGDLVLHVHLGLFGRFLLHRKGTPDPRGAIRLRMEGHGGAVDLRGPTACELLEPDDERRLMARLGPDPLRADADPEAAWAKVHRSRRPIGVLLMDQSVMAGVGNVYRAEALFVNGIHPTRPGTDLDDAELHAIWTTTVSMLRQGVKDNRIITVDRNEMRVKKGHHRRGETTYVYHRDVCLRCGTPVQTVELGGRACYFCPTCQPH